MDFSELEAIEGLRWTWNSWPSSTSEAYSLPVPLSVMFTPLMELAELPILPYEPLHCWQCGGILNPYARVDYRSAVWMCPFCYHKNSFPQSYAGVEENNLPAELFPTYSTVEYHIGPKSIGYNQNHGNFSNTYHGSGRLTSFSSSGSLLTSSYGSTSLSSTASSAISVSKMEFGPVFVFVVDTCTEKVELEVLKKEIMHVVAQLPDNAWVGLVLFGSFVRVHDLGFADCTRMVVFHGERDLSSMQIQDHLGINPTQRAHWKDFSIQKPKYLLPVSECEFIFITALEELCPSLHPLPGYRPRRCMGAAISVSIGILEGYAPNYGARIMVFTSGPATIGPGKIVDTDVTNNIRTHQDIINGHAPYYKSSCNFYKCLSQRLCSGSFVLDLFACSLDQVGAAELKDPIEKTGGILIFAESFESDQFRKSLKLVFNHDGHDCLKMNFAATIDIICSKEVKICGALGPCISLHKHNGSVSENKIGEGGTCSWKAGALTSKTSISFFFQVNNEQKDLSVFLLQFMTQYCHGSGSIRVRATTVARRWARPGSSQLSSGFDQEASAAIMARLAVEKAKRLDTQDVLRWLDKTLVSIASRFGNYIPEDPSSFTLLSNFTLYPQFIYHLRRSQFLDLFNSTPDETAFLTLMVNQQGVVDTLVMIQPTLMRYSFNGPPVPALLDVSSISADDILLFDSFFTVVIHYGSTIAQWRRLGYDTDPNHENLRKLLEAPEIDAESLVAARLPVPKLIRCDQHGSQARFLLARLNPSVTQKSTVPDGTEVIFTDDVSLQVFLEHLQELAVQS